MKGYYDLVLGLIPFALAGIAGGLTLIGIDVTVAVLLGSLVAIALMGHAMFVRSPVRSPVDVPIDTAVEAGPVQSDPTQATE